MNCNKFCGKIKILNTTFIENKNIWSVDCVGEFRDYKGKKKIYFEEEVEDVDNIIFNEDKIVKLYMNEPYIIDTIDFKYSPPSSILNNETLEQDYEDDTLTEFSTLSFDEMEKKLIEKIKMKKLKKKINV